MIGPFRRRWLWGLAVLAVVACRPAAPSLVPENLPLVDPGTVREWTAELIPAASRRYDLRWVFQNQRGSYRGRAAVLLAPPDSFRFDYRAPFGRSGTAVVIGDSVIWSEPEEQVEALIPAAPLFWTALGIPRPAPPGAPIRGSGREGRHVWQYVADGDTLSYVLDRSSLRLVASLTRPDGVLGSVEVVLSDSTGLPAEATMTFPQEAALFILTVRDVQSPTTIDPAVWTRRP